MADRNETAITRGDGKGTEGPQNAKERFYEKLRMPVPVLDGIIAVLIVALVVFLIIGYVKGHQ